MSFIVMHKGFPGCNVSLLHAEKNEKESVHDSKSNIVDYNCSLVSQSDHVAIIA